MIEPGGNPPADTAPAAESATSTTGATSIGSASSINGTVKWFDAKKGYGFLIGPEGQDVFVHFSSIESDGFKVLKDGESVSYVLVAGEKGLSARSVRRTDRNVSLDRAAS